MADNRSCCNTADVVSGGIREAVCIDTNRVYDSCADKDCLADMRVYFTDRAQCIIDNATSVRCRSCKIINCFIDVEAVPFNRGYYSVDITFFFKVYLDAYTTPMNPPLHRRGPDFLLKEVYSFRERRQCTYFLVGIFLRRGRRTIPSHQYKPEGKSPMCRSDLPGCKALPPVRLLRVRGLLLCTEVHLPVVRRRLQRCLSRKGGARHAWPVYHRAA